MNAAEVAAARAAFGEWAAHSLAYRSEAVRRFANVIRKRETEFATLIAREARSLDGVARRRALDAEEKLRTDQQPFERPVEFFRRFVVARFDRFAQFRESAGKSLPDLLDEFAQLRRENLATLRGWNISERELVLEGEQDVLDELVRIARDDFASSRLMRDRRSPRKGKPGSSKNPRRICASSPPRPAAAGRPRLAPPSYFEGSNPTPSS